VISAFVDDDRTNPRWYARILSYGEAFSPAASSLTVKTSEEVYDAVREWLESVLESAAAPNNGSVTKQ
jgi:hypothetical protein